METGYSHPDVHVVTNQYDPSIGGALNLLKNSFVG